jgi:hypothetical protein
MRWRKAPGVQYHKDTPQSALNVIQTREMFESFGL